VGMRVYVPKLRAEADIVEITPSGAIRVAAGSLKLSTTAADIRAVGDSADMSSSAKSGSKRGSAKAGRVEFDAAADPDVPIQTSDNSVDIRGLRAHEAEAMTEQFLDRCLSAGRRVAFVIHGHGTGALRDAVRQTLKNLKCVAKTRPGGPSEGGDGVTVVWLKW
jgi:DNA mismatch repair protein MutS2